LLLEAGRAEESAEWLEKAARTGTPAVRAAVLNLIGRHRHCKAMLRLQARLLREALPAKTPEHG
jgi:hypothetical protein